MTGIGAQDDKGGLRMKGNGLRSMVGGSDDRRRARQSNGKSKSKAGCGGKRLL